MAFHRLSAILIAATLLLWPGRGGTALAPVGHLPTVAVSVTPSIYALPVLMVEKGREWKDFGIQAQIKVHSHGEEQIDRSAGNEWEVGVMDPLSAVKGGNEGNVAIVGIAGNFSSQIAFFTGGSGPSQPPGKWVEWLKSYVARPEFEGEKRFLPACLVATENYADTRKTLVIRWLEAYSRGIQIIRKNPESAASQLREFYGETLKREIPMDLLERDIREAFFFEDKGREEPFRRGEGKPSRVEEFAGAMTRHLGGVKALSRQAEPSDYVLSQLCDQLSTLRGEAVAQLEKTRSSVEAAAKAGARVEDFQKAWEESKAQLQEGRGCLSVIGVLSNLQRSADKARVDSGRLRDFRKIEMGVGGVLACYYAGYFFRRRRRSRGDRAGREA